MALPLNKPAKNRHSDVQLRAPRLSPLDHRPLASEQKLLNDVFAVPINRMLFAMLTPVAELSACPASIEPKAIALELEVPQPDECEFKVAGLRAVVGWPGPICRGVDSRGT